MAYIDNVYAVVNIAPTGVETYVRLSQNENGRTLNFAIVGATIPSGSSVTITGTKPDGNVYSKIGSLSSNTAVFDEDVQLTAVAGSWIAKIEVVNAGNLIATGRIRFVIDADPAAEGIESDSQLEGYVAQMMSIADQVRGEAYGSPLTASTVAGMTDRTRVYVYTGSESGYTSGNWYYWNGSAWVSGGVYNSTAINTDTTLTVAGMAADAKETGDRFTAAETRINEAEGDIADLKEDLTYLENESIVINNDREVPSETNLLDTENVVLHRLYVNDSQGNPTIMTNSQNWYMSNPIEVTPGERLFLYGQLENLNFLWISVLNQNDASQLSSVARVFRYDPSYVVDGLGGGELIVPDDAHWLSIPGAIRNLDRGSIRKSETPVVDYVDDILYNGGTVAIRKLSATIKEGTNLFDAETVIHPKLFVQSSVTGQPAELTGDAYRNFFQSAPIAVTAGSTLVAYGNMNQAIDFWVSILEDDSSVTLENVRQCFRVYPQKSVNNKSYAVIKVPAGAEWLSFSGAYYNASLIYIYRVDDSVSVAEEYGKIYEIRDPFAIHFDSNITLSEQQKAVARTALGITGSDGNTVTPQAYGALGDGVHDDTAAIQAALDSTAKRIYLPPGGYRITDSLVISRSGKYLMGDGSNVARIIPDDSCGDAIVINEAATGTHLYGFLIETTNNANAYAIRINNTQRVSISFVDNLGGSFRQSASKWLHQEGATWSTLMIYHCIIDCGTVNSWAAELVNTSSSARTCDVHMDDVFLDTVLATSGGCLRVDNCNDVHIQNSLYRTQAGTCVRLDTGGRVINEMSVLETFTGSLPSVVINAGTFQNRGGWNKNYDPA